MGTVREISSTELMLNLNRILSEIDTIKAIFVIRRDENNWRDDNTFVLVPLEIGENVLGLYDEEYGWPETVLVEKIEKVSDLAPSYRKHPFITQNGKCIAVGLQLSEYKIIKKQFNM